MQVNPKNIASGLAFVFLGMTVVGVGNESTPEDADSTPWALPEFKRPGTVHEAEVCSDCRLEPLCVDGERCQDDDPEFHGSHDYDAEGGASQGPGDASADEGTTIRGPSADEGRMRSAQHAFVDALAPREADSNSGHDDVRVYTDLRNAASHSAFTYGKANDEPRRPPVPRDRALHMAAMRVAEAAESEATETEEEETEATETGEEEGEEEERPPSSPHLLSWSPWSRNPQGFPRLVGEASSEVEYYEYVAATDEEDKRRNFLSNVHMEQSLLLSEKLSIDSRLRLVVDSDGEDPRFYSDFPHRGVYLIRMRAQYSAEHWSAFGGKYEPLAYMRGHGPIFFGNYTRDLELDGRVGAGASLGLGESPIGRHTLSAQVFRVDRSRLRGEIWSDRWRDDAHLAQAGEIGWSPSYLLSLDGGTEGSDLSIDYTLAAGVQKRGALPKESIALAALLANYSLSPQMELELSMDLMRLRGAGGYDENKHIAAAGAGVSAESYFVGANHSVRRVFDRMDRSTRFDHITEVVARYAISKRTGLGAAYQHVLERGKRENAIGFVLDYSADWIVH